MDNKIVITAIKVLSLGMILVPFIVHANSIGILAAPVFIFVCLPYIFFYFSPNNKKAQNSYVHLIRLCVLLIAVSYGLSGVGALFSDPLYPAFFAFTQAFIVGLVELPMYFFVKDKPSA